jgi:hypothetical protein
MESCGVRHAAQLPSHQRRCCQHTLWGGSWAFLSCQLSSGGCFGGGGQAMFWRAFCRGEGVRSAGCAAALLAATGNAGNATNLLGGCQLAKQDLRAWLSGGICCAER